MESGGYTDTIAGKSSLFKVVVKPGSKVYRYDVSISKALPGSKEIFLTKQSDAHTRNSDVLTCRKIINLVYRKTHCFGVSASGDAISSHDFCYDGKAVLYSLHKFNAFRIDLDAEEVNLERLDIRIKEGSKLNVSIQANAQAPLLQYSDFKDSLLDSNLYTADHSVRTFLELVTSEYLILTEQYQHAQSGTLYHTQPSLNGNMAKKMPGIQIFEGLKKGVRVVDDKTAWLVVDMLRSSFYGSADHQGNSVSLAEVYRQFVRHDKDLEGRRRFEQHFKSVRMVLSFDTSRSIPFHSLSKFPINNQTYNVNGRLLNDYYRSNYGIELIYPTLPGVQTEIGAQNNIIYPMEVLYVLPGQAIPQEKALPEFENSIRPAERYHFIAKQIELFSTGRGRQFLEKFGVRIQDTSNDVTICTRSLPRIKLGNGSIQVSSNGSFNRDIKRARFLHTPNLLRNWVVAFDETIDQAHVQSFVRELQFTLRNSGVTVPDPGAVVPVILERLEEVFEECKKLSYQFILFIDDKSKDSHGRLKFLEAKYKILTQQVTVQAMQIPHQTLKGISMKLNSKCFGLNFLPEFKPYMSDLDLEKNPDLLVIGLDVCHPTASSPKDLAALKQKGYEDCISFHPSVVGISANKNANLCNFSADFFYQESRREELSSYRLEKAIREIIECSFYSGQRNGFVRKPTRLVIVRDGISEGQYKMAMQRELQAIYNGYKQGMHSIGDGELAQKPPKITFLIATKRHSKRFFRLVDGKICNTMPGDVVNERVVRKDVIDECFFQTHNALKGTSQLTQYTVLQNDLQISMLKVQEFMLMLSFMHQVSACPTSLPLPVYLADETAKRGMQIYQEWNKLRMGRRKVDQKSALINETPKSDDLSTRFDQLTEEFHYGHSALVGTRYNS